MNLEMSVSMFMMSYRVNHGPIDNFYLPLSFVHPLFCFFAEKGLRLIKWAWTCVWFCVYVCVCVCVCVCVRKILVSFNNFHTTQLTDTKIWLHISSISFHFISPCDGASGVVGRHPCYSRTYNMGLHRISTLDPTLCWTRVEDIYKIKISDLHKWNIDYTIVEIHNRLIYTQRP